MLVNSSQLSSIYGFKKKLELYCLWVCSRNPKSPILYRVVYLFTCSEGIFANWKYHLVDKNIREWLLYSASRHSDWDQHKSLLDKVHYLRWKAFENALLWPHNVWLPIDNNCDPLLADIFLCYIKQNTYTDLYIDIRNHSLWPSTRHSGISTTYHQLTIFGVLLF